MRILVTGGGGFLGSHLCKKLMQQGHFIYGEGFDINIPFHYEVDQIYNLAGYSDRTYYKEHPEDVIRTSTMGMQNVLDLARELNIPIFQASTVRVYEDEQNAYIEGKIKAEALCMDYPKSKIGRIYGTIGAGARITDNRVFASFSRNAKSNKKLVVQKDQLYKFCFVDDIIDEIINFMNSDYYGIKEIGHPFEISILNLAKLIKATLESESEIEVLS
jgi:UDP-glucuronate decarboxylase